MIGFEQFERDLGVTLPSSYKQLVQVYGQGVWFDILHVLNPFYAWLNDREPWLCRARGYAGGPSWCDRLRESRKQFPDDFIYPIHPEPGGVFPWAFLDEAVLYWLMEGPASQWPTLLGDNDSQRDWPRYDMTVTQLLWGLAANDKSVAGTALATWISPYRAEDFVAIK
jgi:hypothetical protein